MSQPVLTRRQLGHRLRTAREAAGLSVRDVAATKTVASARTLGRLEKGERVSATFPVIDQLCRLYDLPDAVRKQYVQMYIQADSPGWWESYTDAMPARFSLYVELEATAHEMMIYEPDVINGVLQTPDYIRYVHELDTEQTTETVETGIKLRLQRQRSLWDRDPLPQVTVLLSEAALHSKACNEEQFEALSNTPATVRVLSLESGPHVPLRGPFTIIKFDSASDPDVVYTEGLDGSRYEESQAAVLAYERAFKQVLAHAIPIKEYKGCAK